MLSDRREVTLGMCCENLRESELQRWRASVNSEGALWTAKDSCKVKADRVLADFLWNLHC